MCMAVPDVNFRSAARSTLQLSANEQSVVMRERCNSTSEATHAAAVAYINSSLMCMSWRRADDCALATFDRAHWPPHLCDCMPYLALVSFSYKCCRIYSEYISPVRLATLPPPVISHCVMIITVAFHGSLPPCRTILVGPYIRPHFSWVKVRYFSAENPRVKDIPLRQPKICWGGRC